MPSVHVTGHCISHVIGLIGQDYVTGAVNTVFFSHCFYTIYINKKSAQVQVEKTNVRKLAKDI